MEVPMPEKATILAELTAEDLQALPVFITLRETWEAEQQQRVSELEAQSAAKDTRLTELEAAMQVKTQLIAEFQRAKFNADLKAHIAELTAWNTNGDAVAQAKIDTLRDVIYTKTLLITGGVIMEMDQAKEKIDGVIAGDLKVLVEMTRDSIAGGAIRVAGQGRPVTQTAEPTDEQKKQAVQSFGLPA